MKVVKNLNKIFTLLVSLLCLSVLSFMVFSACTVSVLKNIDNLTYIEWRDDGGIFKLRAATCGSVGCGSITLNGKTYEATYEIWTNKSSSFRVSLRAEDAQNLDIEDKQVDCGMVTDSFTPHYDKKERLITSEEGDVELFGVRIGKVRLKAYDIDRADFEIWEIVSEWSDRDEKLIIHNYGGEYVLFKCLHSIVKMPNGEDELVTFRWLPDTSGFCIYDYVGYADYWKVNDDTSRLAEGTYELNGNNVILHFTNDELLGFQGQSLYLFERG